MHAEPSTDPTNTTGRPPLAADAILAAIPDCVLIIDHTGNVRFVNEAAEVQLGYRGEDWIGRSLLELIHPDDVLNVLAAIESVQDKAVGTPVEVRVRDAVGAWHWFEEVGSNVVLDDGTPAILVVARDLTRRRMWEVAGDDVARFRQVVQVAPAITLLLDIHGVVVSANGAFTRLLGHDQGHVIGKPFVEYVADSHVDMARAAIDELLVTGGSTAFETLMTVHGAAPGTTRPIRFEMVDHVADPIIAGIVVNGYDVTELTAVREELEYLALHDPLTGLATRGHLLKHAESLLRSGAPFAVLFIDLDRFKPINDLWGHESGDEILRLVARRLQQTVRPLDLVARVGGDEFVVVAHGVTDEVTATVFAERIETALTAPYEIDAGPIRIGASVGVAVGDGRSTVDMIIADADLAMYDTKSERRGRAMRSSAERKRSAIERRRLADDLIVGLDRGEIVAHLQPIVDVRSGTLLGLEALARWNHPRLGILRPAAFMEVVQDAGLDSELGEAVLESACITMAALDTEISGLDLAVNLSVGQLTDPRLVDRIDARLRRYGLLPEQLTVEITEQAILAPLSGAGTVPADETLLAVHALGAKLSLDDFGTGYSSLTHVRRFPLSAIKIDRSFVAGLTTSTQDRAVVDVIVRLAETLHLDVVAEGVETAEQLSALHDLGCTSAQGHHIAEPLSSGAVVQWVRDRVRPPH